MPSDTNQGKKYKSNLQQQMDIIIFYIINFRTASVPENDQKGVYTAQKGNPFPLDQHQCLQRENPAKICSSMNY